eukprot:COSAG01_NODE_36493_length_517_cov_0.610048_1_plen_37_part_10
MRRASAAVGGLLLLHDGTDGSGRCCPMVGVGSYVQID